MYRWMSQTIINSNLSFAKSKSTNLMFKKDRNSTRIFFDFKFRCVTSRECKYRNALKIWKNIFMIFFTAMKFSLNKFFKFSKEKYDIIRKNTKFFRKFTTWTIFFCLTIKFFSIHTNDHVYMRILSHYTNFSANLIQLIFFLLFFAFSDLFSLRFVKFFANICRVDVHVDNFVHFFERVISQFSFTNINEKLPENEKLIKLCDNDMIVDFKYIKRRKNRAIIFKKIIYFLVIFDFARFVIEQFDFEIKFANVDIDFSFLIFFSKFKIQMKWRRISFFAWSL